MSGAEILVIGSFRLPAGELEAARPAMRAMISASRAEKECLDYGYAEDVLAPGLIHVREVWASRAGLDAHFASKHLSRWRAAWPELRIFDRKLVLYEIGAPRPI